MTQGVPLVVEKNETVAVGGTLVDARDTDRWTSGASILVGSDLPAASYRDQVRRRLSAGGRPIRTAGPPRKNEPVFPVEREVP
jgi:hypothetical protein